jgi:hypothetical protein
MSFLEALLWGFFIFVWIAAIFVWVRVLFDLFSDHTLSGWGKAGWAIFLVLLPLLGALVYLIARGKSMTERQLAAVEDARVAQEKYIKQVAGQSSTPAEQIAQAKSLLDSGAISAEEFESMKAKALA